MINELTNGKINLKRTELMNFRAAAGATIACDRGLVWVTQEGERDDYWLLAGETLKLRRTGSVVIEAAQQSRVAIRQPAPRAWQALIPGLARRAAHLDAC